jgi:4'-phosphopantetheinyl transferase
MIETSVTQQPRPRGIVDVWPMSLVGDPEHHLGLLSGAELARYGRRRGEQARRFAIAHGRMREVLGRYVGCAPDEVPVSARHGEPPYLRGLCLSLSHSEDLALLAVGRSAVGVDIEDAETDSDEEISDVALLTLSPRELAVVAGTRQRDRVRAWLRFWARREAVLKARPDALADRSISDLDVSQSTVLDVAVEDLDLGPRYVGALAHAGTETNVVVKDLQR